METGTNAQYHLVFDGRPKWSRTLSLLAGESACPTFLHNSATKALFGKM
jgi:hypothetical protein